MEYTQHAYIYNSIFWGNEDYEICGGPSNESVVVDLYYNNIESFDVCEAYFTPVWHEGNINTDPLFEIYGDFEYYLSNESPCVNAGTPDTTGINLPEFDIAGNPRIYGNRIDMGALENQVVIDDIHDIIHTDIKIRLQPNPVTNNLHIEYELAHEGKINFTLSDLQGACLKEVSCGYKQVGIHHFIYDCIDLAAGIYLLHIYQNNKQSVRKFVKF